MYTAEKIVELFCTPENDGGFISFTLRLINELKQIGKKRTADTYTTVLNSFKRFRSNQDLLLDDVDSTLMTEYETWLKENGICKIQFHSICAIFEPYITVRLKKS